MYRQRTTESEMSEEKFVDRLYELPVVHTAFGKLGELYTGTKEHNRLFRFTLQTAESSLGVMMNTAKPVVSKFEKPIGTLNDVAYQQLLKLEKDYPIITQPTDVVMKQTMETCNNAVKPITDRVRPITERVGNATQYGVDKVNDVKNFTVGTINGVATYGVNKVNDVKSLGINGINAVSDAGSKQVYRIFANQTGQMMLERAENVIDIADIYVDRYFPAEAEETSEGVEKKSAAKGGMKKIDVDEVSRQSVVFDKAYQLSSKVRQRAYNRMAKRMKILKMRSLETVDKLHFNVDLIEYARKNIDGAKQKAGYIWEEINKSPEELAKEANEDQENYKNMTFERRVIATARQLTWKLKSGLSSFSMESVPAPIRSQLERAVAMAQSLFDTFKSRAKTGLTDEDLDSVKNSISNLRNTISNVKDWDPASHLAPVIEKVFPGNKADNHEHHEMTTMNNDSKSACDDSLNRETTEDDSSCSSDM